MNIGNFASSVTEEHELFLTALNGRYLQALTPGKAITPRDLIDLERGVIKLMEGLYARVSDKTAELVTSLDLPDEKTVTASVARLVKAFEVDFAAVLLKNVVTVTMTARRGKDDFGNMFTQSLGKALGSLMLRKAQKLDFKVPDSAGRKWDASRYMSFITREFVYRMKLAKQVSELVGDFAEVFYPDHDSDGIVFSVRGHHPGMPTYAELLPTVFHPNSKAEVRPHAFA